MSQGLCTSCGASVNLAAAKDEINCTYCGKLVKRQEAEAQFVEIKNSKFGGALLIAETAQEGGSYTEALNYYNKVIEQQPDFADAWLNKGTCMVRTSKIGDLKIPEAISSWKAAIKFAKNPEAMKKRVALEINNAVTGFYPILERHYLEFRSLDHSLSEHGSRFLLLASALTWAMELDPNNVIANTGTSLCNRFIASVTAAENDSSFGKQLSSDWKQARLSAEDAKKKYEQMLAKADPEFAKQIIARDKREVENVKIGGFACLTAICLFVGSAAVSGSVESGFKSIPKSILAFGILFTGVWFGVKTVIVWKLSTKTKAMDENVMQK